MTKRTDERLVLTGAAHSELSVRQGVTGHSAESRGLNRSATRAFIILGCFLLQGCGAGWRRLDPLEPGPLRVRQQAQVWHHGQADRWHAVFITPDSVSGVPYAAAAGVKTLVLSHFVPPDDPETTEQMWLDAARAHFSGTIIVGRDLLEV